MDSSNGRYKGFIPIDEMGLSVRSYNCLIRAGIDTVEKLQEMRDDELLAIRNLSSKCLAEIRQKLSEMPLRKADSAPMQAAGYMDMLEELVGLDPVKEQVRKIIAFAKMKKDLMKQGRDKLSVSLNMEFVGNPGSAKTTVARLLAGIFHEIGLLSRPELVEVGRADLIAKYEGQTASRVKDVFREAKGRLLFIDEAYSLVESWEGAYGDEAINTIVQEMENHREDTIVIFAGYPDKMQAFFSRNPGLRSRVPFSVSFQDYSAAEMLQIAQLEAKKRGLSIGPSAMDKVFSICELAAGKKGSGNGRFCRNLIENAVLGYAVRVYGCESSTDNDSVSSPPDRCFELSAEDFSIPDTLKSPEKVKNPIGF